MYFIKGGMKKANYFHIMCRLIAQVLAGNVNIEMKFFSV